MRILIVLIAISAITSSSMAADSAKAAPKKDVANGNLIAEPKLADYHVAERTPGFSPITDIVDANGN